MEASETVDGATDFEKKWEGMLAGEKQRNDGLKKISNSLDFENSNTNIPSIVEIKSNPDKNSTTNNEKTNNDKSNSDDSKKEPKEGKDISESSFKFVKTGGNWQEAGVSKLKIKIRFLGGPRNGESVNVIIQYALIFGLPIKRFDNSVYSPTDAAEIAAQSVRLAEAYTYQLVKDDPFLTREQVQSTFINSIRLFMLNSGGTLNRTGSGSPKIKVNEADYSWF